MLRIIVVLVLVVSTCAAAWSQNSENSPYSRFGIGNLADPFLVHQGTMGGWSAAFNDPNLINYMNPASLASLKATSFEVGIFGRYNTLSDNLRSTNQWGGNLSYFSLAFPIKNPLNDAFDRKQRKFFWGSGLTLVPYSNVSYSITTTDFQQNIGRVTRQYTGEGGTYRLLISNGWKYNKLSAGVNTGIIFGQLRKNRVVFLEDFTNHATDLFEETQLINAFTLDLGFQYELVFNEKKRKETNKPKKAMTFGLYGNSDRRYTTEFSQLIHRANSAADPFVRDTLFQVIGARERGVLPLSITGGIGYTIDAKFRGGIDYNIARWTNFTNPANTSEVLANTWMLNGGVEYIPNANAISGYLKKVRYRAGFKIGTDPRIVAGEQLSFFEINTGMGLPFIVAREVSQLHIGFTYGQFGGPTAPIRESFFRVNFGYTFLDNTWFVKRRFY